MQLLWSLVVVGAWSLADIPVNQEIGRARVFSRWIVLLGSGSEAKLPLSVQSVALLPPLARCLERP